MGTICYYTFNLNPQQANEQAVHSESAATEIEIFYSANNDVQFLSTAVKYEIKDLYLELIYAAEMSL